MAELSNGPNAGLKITALSVLDVVKIISGSGGRKFTEATVRADVAAGAPVNPDQTLNLVCYTAWLVKEVAKHDD